jgi:general secretion pathway protein I
MLHRPRPEPSHRALHLGRYRLRGLTLIETLVALTIVALGLAAGLKAASALADNTERLADVLAAQWCADNHLTGLRLSQQFPPVGDSDIPCTQGDRNYTIHLVVRPTPNPQFRRVDANLRDASDRPVLTLTTILPLN